MGAQLKTIRLTQTDLSLEAAAEALQWSSATMSRTENGKRHITAEDVATVLAIYRVPIELRNALVARAKANNEPAWWSRPLPGVPDNTGTLARYEADAHTIIDWSVNLIPGMLQTYEYARAYMLDDGVSVEDVEPRWVARLCRQERLPKLDYTAFIGEAAIKNPFGGRAFIGQLKHLLDKSMRGVGIRIVPAHRPHSALLQSWMLLKFPDTPPIVEVDLLRSAVFLHDEETMHYSKQLSRLGKIALSTDETRDTLRKLIELGEGRR